MSEWFPFENLDLGLGLGWDAQQPENHSQQPENPSSWENLYLGNPSDGNGSIPADGNGTYRDCSAVGNGRVEPSRHIDAIEGTIDAALADAGQSSREWSFNTDRFPELCVRCQSHDPVEGGDFCRGCRSFLLEDSDEDPKNADVPRFLESQWSRVHPDDVIALGAARHLSWGSVVAVPAFDYPSWRLGPSEPMGSVTIDIRRYRRTRSGWERV